MGLYLYLLHWCYIKQLTRTIGSSLCRRMSSGTVYRHLCIRMNRSETDRSLPARSSSLMQHLKHLFVLQLIVAIFWKCHKGQKLNTFVIDSSTDHFLLLQLVQTWRFESCWYLASGISACGELVLQENFTHNTVASWEKLPLDSCG